MASFLQRKEAILASFESAKAEMEQLNADIETQIEANKQAIISFQNENQELSELIAKNNSSVKALSKFFVK